MSYGSYDNQSSLNQPFNPTATTNNRPGGLLGTAVNSISTSFGKALPGAQDPNSQQYFQQANESHQELGQALQNIQGMGNRGGKSIGGGMQFGGNGKSGTPDQIQGQSTSNFNGQYSPFNGQ